MLVVSYGIFHKRRGKIMGLIPQIRAGIAALTFAAVVTPLFRRSRLKRETGSRR
jgi:hypothetical protein